MSTVTMNIQQALSKKKILEDQVKNMTHKYIYIGYEKEINLDSDAVKEKIASMQSAFNKNNALIKNLASIKAALEQHNATCKITVAGVEYTKAEAIARHRAIGVEQTFYSVCRDQLTKATNAVESTNNDVLKPEKVADYVAKTLGTESKRNEQLIESQKESYIKDNTVVLVDPNKLTEKIDDMYNNLVNFEAEIHNALVASNVREMIVVEFED